MKKLEKKGKSALAGLLCRLFSVKKISPDSFSQYRIRNLLIVRQHNQMGDMLLAVPAFRGLRNRFREARISLIAASLNSEVMLYNPYVDEVLTYAKERHKRHPLRLLKFVRELRRRRFDAVLVLNTVSFSVTSMFLAVASGAAIRIGSTSLPFGHDFSSRIYNLELPLPSADELRNMHEGEHNLYPLSVIGVYEEDLSSVLVPREGDVRESGRLISAAFPAGSDFIVVHPGAGKKQNIWPPVNLANVAGRLVRRFNLNVIAVRGPVDGEAMDSFLSSCEFVPFILSCPAVGFLGALLRKASLTICNDTGVMHIAGAVGARCIAVFGPTDPGRWKPVGDHVTAVRSGDGRIESVTVEEVFSLAKRLLKDLPRDEVDL